MHQWEKKGMKFSQSDGGLRGKKVKRGEGAEKAVWEWGIKEKRELSIIPLSDQHAGEKRGFRITLSIPNIFMKHQRYSRFLENGHFQNERRVKGGRFRDPGVMVWGASKNRFPII